MTEKWRQKLHLEPPEGWLNDPNGLSYFNHKYHVYFQYSPNSPEGKNPKCWGHFEGETLLNLEYKGIVLRPTALEDRNGVFSGCAIVHDGLLHLFYTGNVKEKGNYNYITNGRSANVIHVTTNDGQTMSQKQIVLRNCDYPDFCTCHVRDPKVWQDGDGWKMVLGARTIEDNGCILIYRSNDLENWEYVTAVQVSDFGYMWECPDYFEINGKGFLAVSPQGMRHYETKYQNLYQSGYFSVNGSLEDNQLVDFTEWDMGFDFYAPQTFEAPDGRRILIGWMGMDKKVYANPTVSLGWQHCLTLPREITVNKNGKLLQNPIKEITTLRKSEMRFVDGTEKNITLPFELVANITNNFQITFDSRLNINFICEQSLVTLEFLDELYGGGRTIRRAELSQCSNIRIIVDTSSLEIYLNNGSTVLSTRFYPEHDIISLNIQGCDATIWQLSF